MCYLVLSYKAELTFRHCSRPDYDHSSIASQVPMSSVQDALVGEMGMVFLRRAFPITPTPICSTTSAGPVTTHGPLKSIKSGDETNALSPNLRPRL